MGRLLLISLGCTLVASLVLIPALLAAVPRPAVANPSKRVLGGLPLGSQGIDFDRHD